jgi:3'-5' exoribonuclease
MTPDKEQLLKEFDELIGKISNWALQKACRAALCPAFFNTPASAKKHQPYSGGLAEHTLDVTNLALRLAKAYGTMSHDVLIAGGLFHDYGKIWDYGKIDQANNPYDENLPEYGYTRHRWTVRHRNRSHAEFHRLATENGVSPNLIEEVSHAILTHHGPGSCELQPLTPEAFILYSADTLNAFYNESSNPHPFRFHKQNWKTP